MGDNGSEESVRLGLGGEATFGETGREGRGLGCERGFKETTGEIVLEEEVGGVGYGGSEDVNVEKGGLE